jgi:hypothetical protein
MIQASKLPNVTVQILPYAVGAHPALNSTFILLDFLSPVPPVVFVEGLVGQLYLERPEDVERYDQIFERLQSVALTPQQSVSLVRRVATAYKRELRVKAANTV